MLQSITQACLKDEALGSDYYKMLLYSDSIRSEVCTDIRNLGRSNLSEKFKRRILIY